MSGQDLAKHRLEGCLGMIIVLLNKYLTAPRSRLPADGGFFNFLAGLGPELLPGPAGYIQVHGPQRRVQRL